MGKPLTGLLRQEIYGSRSDGEKTQKSSKISAVSVETRRSGRGKMLSWTSIDDGIDRQGLNSMFGFHSFDDWMIYRSAFISDLLATVFSRLLKSFPPSVHRALSNTLSDFLFISPHRGKKRERKTLLLKQKGRRGALS